MSVPNNVPRTVGYSPKFTLTTIVLVLVGIAISILNAIQADSSLLGSLPPWLQFVIVMAIPPVLGGLTAYQAPPGDVVGGDDRAAPGAVGDDLSGI